MNSFLNRLLVVLSLLFCCFPAGAVAYEDQQNFTLSAGEEPGTYDLIATPVPGRVYFFQCSADQQTWLYGNTVKLGTTGTPLKYTIAPVSGQKHFFRLLYTLDNNYTAGGTGDIDEDGLSNAYELIAGTNPFKLDTDGDTLGDGIEILAGLSPTQQDDPSPGIFSVQWEKTEYAALSPKGWSSGSNSAPEPNFYRNIHASATESKNSTATGEEFNVGKTMTIERTMLPPVRYEDAVVGKIPVYGETVNYSHTTGQAFVSMSSHQTPSAWSSPAPGAVAYRDKWSGQNIHDYEWIYAQPVTNQTISGEFRTPEMEVPSVTYGARHTWTNPPVAVGGNRYVLANNYPVLLPNRNFPIYGDVLDGGDWVIPSYCLTVESPAGISTGWTLSNRYTYADVRSELETLRTNIRHLEERQNEMVEQSGSAFRTQEINGDAAVQIYQFKFVKVGGGVGPTTLIWPETFQATDNPETTNVNEFGALPQVRMHAVHLPANATETPVFVVDPRVSPFSQLPGEVTSPASFGYTTIGRLIEPGFQILAWNVVFSNPQHQYYHLNGPAPVPASHVAIGGSLGTLAPGGSEQMVANATVKLKFPVDSPDADELAASYDLFLYQNILSNDVNEVRYQTGAKQTNVTPLPGLDANGPPEGWDGEDSIPIRSSFSSDGETLSLRLSDSPGNTVELDFNLPGTTGPLRSVKQDTKFCTWLFAQDRYTKQRHYLKWFTWQIKTNVEFNTTAVNDDTVLLLSTTKLSEGDGRGPHTPSDVRASNADTVVP